MLTVMKRSHGFTLIELMVTLSIIAIVAAVGFPQIRELMANNKFTTKSNDLLATFQFARSEALRRTTTVRIEACKPDCGTTGTADWTNGWRVWVDEDGDDVLDAGEEVLNEHESLSPDMTITAHGGVPFATAYDYLPEGRLDITNSNELLFCDSRTGETGRLLQLTIMGRASVEREPCT